ncbi:MAG: dTDP-4-dehydrorhamnose 3,5-epimerase family protein [Anaeroplasmataceae bacterium]
MKAIRQIFRDVLLIEPDVERDDRGYITTRYSEDDFNNIKIDGIYVEEKVYQAIKKASMFGIYYQDDPYLQNKILYCQNGSIMVYIVDLDSSSPTYKEWICVELDAKGRKQLFIPQTYGYGFLTMEDNTEVVVKTDEYQTDGYFRYITYLDKNIGLEFPFDEIISTYKEKQAPTLRDE